MVRSVCLALAVVSATGAGAATYSDPFTDFIVVGDSLSDPGNLFRLTGGAVPPSPPYAGGRFSTGPVWAEHIAADFAATGKPTLNAAHGFAKAVADDDIWPVDLPQELAIVAAAAPAFGDRPLASLWIGANDLFSGIQLGTPVETALAGAQATIAAGLTLAGLGVTDLILFDQPDLADIPLFRLFASDLADEAAAASAAYNAALAAGYDTLRGAGLNLFTVDTDGLIGQLLANPTAFGVSDARLPCIFPSLEAAAEFSQPLFCDPATSAERAFADQLHPSGAIHVALAEVVRDELQPIPLPAGLPLLVGALAALGVIRRPAGGGGRA